MRRLVAGMLVATGLVASYAATGLVVVAPGEVAVVRRWGRVLPTPRPPGLHLGWPAGVDRVDRVELDRVRRLELGLAGIPGITDDPGAGEYLTGDRNLIRARAVVQYRVDDPVAFVLQGPGLGAILVRSAEAHLGRVLSSRPIDELLGIGKVQAARELADDLAGDWKALRLGVAVLGVSLTDARPPAEVDADFAKAQSARNDVVRRRQEARGQAERTRIAAEAEAQATLARARTDLTRTVERAAAESDRFQALLAELQPARRLTIRRLYLKALADLLPRVGRKVLLTPGEPLDLSVFDPGMAP